jgi:hypothetical protein
MAWWQQAKLDMQGPSAALLMPWMIWKKRNECIFEARIKDEAALSQDLGAKGLRVILPTNWDVH